MASFLHARAALLPICLSLACGSDGETADLADDGTDGTDGADDDGSVGTGDTTGDGSSGAAPTSGITWHEHIAPLILPSCAGCHRDGGIAPFSFESYEGTQPLAEAIVAAVESGAMPPFAASETADCEPKHGWKDDLRLSEDDKQMLRDWANDGAPEGDPSLAAEVPAVPQTTLQDPDQSLRMAGSTTIEGTTDRFVCYSLDPGLTEDAFIEAIQVVPGNDKIVHHVLIYVDESGDTAELADEDGAFDCSGGALGGALVGAWAPGAVPNRMPADAGMQIPAGARLVMNVHYHPTGVGPEVDEATGIDIVWTEERPFFAARLSLVGNAAGGDALQPGPNDDNGVEFLIPAGVSAHTESMRFTIPDGFPQLRVFSVGSHMHYAGVDMLIEVERPSGDDECLLQTPTYKFEWQRSYTYDADINAVPRLQAGDVLTLRCTYNNTMDNPSLAEALRQAGKDEPQDIVLGDETNDEMCLAVIGTVFPNVL